MPVGHASHEHIGRDRTRRPKVAKRLVFGRVVPPLRFVEGRELQQRDESAPLTHGNRGRETLDQDLRSVLVERGVDLGDVSEERRTGTERVGSNEHVAV